MCASTSLHTYARIVVLAILSTLDTFALHSLKCLLCIARRMAAEQCGAQVLIINGKDSQACIHYMQFFFNTADSRHFHNYLNKSVFSAFPFEQRQQQQLQKCCSFLINKAMYLLGRAAYFENAV